MFQILTHFVCFKFVAFTGWNKTYMGNVVFEMLKWKLSVLQLKYYTFKSNPNITAKGNLLTHVIHGDPFCLLA